MLGPRPLFLGFMLLWASSCSAAPQPPIPRPAPLASAPTASAAASLQVPAPPPRPWGLAYERACFGESSRPHVSAPPGNALYYCRAQFAFPQGRLVRSIPGIPGSEVVAELPKGTLLIKEFGFASWSPGADHLVENSSEQSHLADTVVSPDKSLVLASERVDHRGSVVLRELPSLRVRLRVALESAGWEDRVAFLADNRPIALTRNRCKTENVPCEQGARCSRTECEEVGVFEVKPTGLSLLGPVFRQVKDMAVSKNGERAVLVREDGRREIVHLPEGTPVAPLPALPEDCSGDCTRVALSPQGDRVAYLDSSGVQIGQILESRVQVLHTEERLKEFFHLDFGPEGKSLLLTDMQGLHVLREGSTALRPSPSAYSYPLPKGYEKASAQSESSSPQLGQVFDIFNEDDEVHVEVFAGDPAEFDAEQELEAWAAAVRGRHEDGYSSEEIKVGRLWKDRSARSQEYAVFSRTGCDWNDRYVRVSERNGVLYRVEVTFPPGTPVRRVTPVLNTFFDEGFGDGPSKRALAKVPPVPSGPC